MTTEGIVGIAGGLAAIVAVIWAMFGNPNVLDWRSKHRVPKNARPVQAAKRKSQTISWRQITSAAEHFAKHVPVKYDLVLGIQPDGIPIANLIAAHLEVGTVPLDKQYTDAKRSPFYIFEPGTQVRSVRPSSTHMATPVVGMGARRVLIVDAVTTFGNTLISAEEAVKEQLPDVVVDFYVFAIDEVRLATAHPELLPRTTHSIAIDNGAVWLIFPWQTAR